jgi:hypothetical protein
VHSSKWDADYVGWKPTASNAMGEGWITPRDHAILTAIDAESMPWWKGIHLTQGGLSTAVAASASTHNGLGSFDIRSKYNSKAQVWRLSAMFLRSGIVAFPRGYGIGYDYFRNTKHIHAVSRESYSSLHPSAKAQYQEYDNRGGDGLVGSAKYTGPKTDFERWTTSPYRPANITANTNLYTVDVASGFLWGLDVDRVKRVATDNGAHVQAVKQVQRWGRPNAVTAAGLYYALQFLKVKP